MPKPPGTLGAKTRKNFLNLIIPQSSASIKPSQKQRSLACALALSHARQQPDGCLQIYPALPEYLDKFLDEAWTPENSRRVDLWLWYVQQEFETLGGE